MNIQDIIKVLAEKGFDISELEVQSKIDAFSRDFSLPAEEAARAALSHFMSVNQLSAASAKSKGPAPGPAAQVQTPVSTPTTAQAAVTTRDINEKVFALIVELSSRVPYHLANLAEVIREAASAGIAQSRVEEAVKTLIENQRCIEPLIGELYPRTIPPV